MMEVFDLGIAWNWAPDADFIREINDRALAEGLKPYIIHAFNFYTSLKDISEQNIRIKFFLDRTVLDPSPICKIGEFLIRNGVVFINYQDKAKRLLRRSTTHHEPIRHNILIPTRIMIKPGESIDTSRVKLSCLPRPFVLKAVDGPPDAETIRDAASADDLYRLRDRYGDITYVAQEIINPKTLGNRQASFRCVYCGGDVIPSWWDPAGNTYEPVSGNDIEEYDLNHLILIANQIANITKLEFFSTGIVLDSEDEFFVTDYLNLHPDMRRKSRLHSGLPDSVVDKVIDSMVSYVKKKSG